VPPKLVLRYNSNRTRAVSSSYLRFAPGDFVGLRWPVARQAPRQMNPAPILGSLRAPVRARTGIKFRPSQCGGKAGLRILVSALERGPGQLSSVPKFAQKYPQPKNAVVLDGAVPLHSPTSTLRSGLNRARLLPFVAVRGRRACERAQSGSLFKMHHLCGYYQLGTCELYLAQNGRLSRTGSC